jgi:uncharacterized protein YabE (DUF348 family)
MRRVFATALAGLLLGVGLLGAGVAQAFAKSVTLVVDGEETQISVVHATVAEVVARAGVQVNARDEVDPALGLVVADGTVITVTHARPVQLNLDGRTGTYWTTATTVGELVAELGLAERDVALSHPKSTAISLAGLLVGIDSAKNVTVTAAGVTTELRAPGHVADALRQLGLAYDADDIVTPAPTAWLEEGMAITLTVVDVQTVERDVDIPFETQATNDASLYTGQTAVDQAGQNGVRHETVRQTLHDGQVVAEEVLASAVTREPVTQIQRNGTAARPVSIASENQQIGYDMVIARGLGDAEFVCLQQLWDRESHWNTYAQNAYSGAYGIPQALPGNKMASHGADWQTNPATQIAWGLDYIAGRYGTPCGAWNYFLSHNYY